MSFLGLFGKKKKKKQTQPTVLPIPVFVQPRMPQSGGLLPPEYARLVGLREQEQALSRDVGQMMDRIGAAMAQRGVSDSSIAAGNYKQILQELTAQRAALRRQALMDIWNLRDIAMQRLQSAVGLGAQIGLMPMQYLGGVGAHLMAAASAPIGEYTQQMLSGLEEMARANVSPPPSVSSSPIFTMTVPFPESTGVSSETGSEWSLNIPPFGDKLFPKLEIDWFAGHFGHPDKKRTPIWLQGHFQPIKLRLPGEPETELLPRPIWDLAGTPRKKRLELVPQPILNLSVTPR